MAGIGHAPDIVKSGLDEIFYGKYERQLAPSFTSVFDPMVFRQKTSMRDGENTEVFAGTGIWGESQAEQGKPDDTEFQVGQARYIQNRQWFQDLPIANTLMEDDQYGVIQEAVAGMGDKAYLTQQIEGMGLYRNAFGSTLTNDGVSLISASHVNLNGDTVSNLLTGDLTPDNLEEGISRAAEQVDQRGEVTGFMPKVLLVPHRLWKTAIEITKSELISDSANNAINWFSSEFNLIVKMSAYLGAVQGGSDTAWFLLGDSHTVIRQERLPVTTEYVEPKYNDGYTAKYRGRYRETYAAITYEQILGSTGL